MSQDLEKKLSETPISAPASLEFRTELRRRFVSGDFAEGGHRQRKPAGKLLRFLMPVAAAAAVVAVTLLLPEDPRWRVHIEGDGPIVVSEVELGGAERREIEVELSRGGRLESGANTVELLLEDELLVMVLPETVVELVPLPVDSTDQLIFTVESGEIFLKSLAEDLAFPLIAETTQARVVPTGTVFGVLVDERGTCVCVAEGAVDVMNKQEGMRVDTVLSEHVFLIFRPEHRMDPKSMTFADEAELSAPLIEFAR